MGVQIASLNRVAGVVFIDGMTFEQRAEENIRNSHVSVWRQDIIDRGSYCASILWQEYPWGF